MVRMNSRLMRVEEKRNIKKAVWLSLGTIVIVVGIVVLGIPALVRMAVFIGDIKGTNQPVDKNDLIPPGPPRVDIAYDATNSATIAITGVSEPGSTIYLTDNNESVGNQVTKDDGTFQFASVPLKDGNNVFEAVAVDAAGNKSQNSGPTGVEYLTKAPALNIDSPSDRQQVNGKTARVDIKGSTDSGARVTVNDRILIVGSDGKFASMYTLNQGDNVLVFVSTDRAGNQTRKELVVTYAP